MNKNSHKYLPSQNMAPATAAGQYLGYSLQQTLLATRLRQAAAGSACSLEVLDDVAEQSADGTTHLVQSKSALTENPVADRAVALWKTLYNWLELVKLKLVDPETTTFEIYVSRPVTGWNYSVKLQATLKPLRCSPPPATCSGESLRIALSNRPFQQQCTNTQIRCLRLMNLW